jgi:hypothetical protein
MKHTLDDRLAEIQKRLGGIASPNGRLVMAARRELDRLARADDSERLLDHVDTHECNIVVMREGATRSKSVSVRFRDSSRWHVKPTAREALREALDELKEFKK